MGDPRRVAEALDACLRATVLDAAGHARIVKTLRRERSPGRPRWIVLPVAAALAAVFGLLLGALLGARVRQDAAVEVARSERAEAPQPSPEGTASWVALEPSCDTRNREGVLTLEGQCELALMQPPMRIQVIDRARVIPTADGVEVLEGWIVFDVEPVDEAPPVRIGLPGGVIEVLGTRFSVWTDGDRGHIDLVEGRIRFRGPRGVELLEPGQRASWAGDETRVPDTTEARSTAPREPPHSNALPLRESVRELARLRARGRHAEALELVDRLLEESSDPAAAETLSYEKGTLLQATGRKRAACRHWSVHLRRFPGDRRAVAIERHRVLLGCAPAEH